MGQSAPVWITRARPAAEATAARVTALGFESLVDPLLAVEALDADIDLAQAKALAFTSGNGVEAFARLSDERALPVFAVGRATAQAAKAAGFISVASADGDVEALCRSAKVKKELLAQLTATAKAGGLKVRRGAVGWMEADGGE